MKKIILSLLLFMVTGYLTIHTIQTTHADSGWDTSYDSSSSSSSSDWGSSSSWSSSSSWDSSSSGSGDLSDGGEIFIIIIVIVVIWLIWATSAKPSEKKYYSSDEMYNDVSEELLQQYNINREEFLNIAFEKYVKIQEAWMNFDYDTLKELLTDELYNTYYAQLEALKLKNQQNIMSDFKYIKGKIINIKEENNILCVSIYLNITMYDYVVNYKQEVIRGNNKRKVNIEYVINFVRPLNNKKVNNCPNCGGKLNETAREKCEHCGTIIVKSLDEFVMSKKTNIGQR